MDFALALIPITVFWNLQISLKKRFSLCVLMSWGLLYVLHSISYHNRTDLTSASEHSAAVCGAVKTAKFTKINAIDFTCQYQSSIPSKHVSGRPNLSQGKNSICTCGPRKDPTSARSDTQPADLSQRRNHPHCSLRLHPDPQTHIRRPSDAQAHLQELFLVVHT